MDKKIGVNKTLERKLTETYKEDKYSMQELLKSLTDKEVVEVYEIAVGNNKLHTLENDTKEWVQWNILSLLGAITARFRANTLYRKKNNTSRKKSNSKTAAS